MVTRKKQGHPQRVLNSFRYLLIGLFSTRRKLLFQAKSKKNNRVLAIAFLLLTPFVISGCDISGNNTEIVGYVFDNFKNPIEGAEVSISESAFQTTTDDSGHFSLDYVPGAFNLQIAATGFTSRAVDLDIRQATQYPLSDTVLYKVPGFYKGMFLVGREAYLPLINGNIERKQSKGKGFLSTTYTYSVSPYRLLKDREIEYLLQEFSDENTKNKRELSLLIIDNTSDTMGLFELTEATIGKFSTGPMSNSNNFPNLVPEDYEQFDGFKVRKVSYPVDKLKSGKMICYVKLVKTMAGQKVISEVAPAYCLSGKKETLQRILSVKPGYRNVTKDASIEKKYNKIDLMNIGKEVYARNCAACHQSNGEGIPNVFPALAGSSVAGGEKSMHIYTVKYGVAGTAMQDFGGDLNDTELAAVITYERNSWGNNGGTVQPSEIATVRK